MRTALLGLTATCLVGLACVPRAPSGTQAASERDDGFTTPASLAAVEVVVFGTDWCPVCRRAREFLDRGGYRYRWLDIDSDPVARARHRILNPRGSVPTFLVEGRLLVGFSGPVLRETVLEAARGRPTPGSASLGSPARASTFAGR